MAVPFIPDEALHNNADDQLMQIERMLKELLVLTRWSAALSAISVRQPPLPSNDYNNPQQIQEERAYGYHRPNFAVVERNLPDLLSTCPAAVHARAVGARAIAPRAARVPAAGPRAPAPGPRAPAPGARAPAVGGARVINVGAAASVADAVAAAVGAMPRTVTLQVEVCPDCYYHGNGRKLKVIGVTRVEKTVTADVAGAEHHDHDVSVLEDDAELVQQLRAACRNAAQPSADHQHDEDFQNADQSQMRATVGYGSKVARHLVTLLNPSAIETSFLTAVFVVVGWKMFIKQ